VVAQDVAVGLAERVPHARLPVGAHGHLAGRRLDARLGQLDLAEVRRLQARALGEPEHAFDEHRDLLDLLAVRLAIRPTPGPQASRALPHASFPFQAGAWA
jgi:hypothetical protein